MQNWSTVEVSKPRYRPRPTNAVGGEIERRSDERIPVRDVLVHARGEVRGRILDLSKGGVALLTSTRIRPGQHIKFEIHSDFRAEICGTVRWARLDRLRPKSDGTFEPIYVAGIALDHQPQLCNRRHNGFH